MTIITHYFFFLSFHLFFSMVANLSACVSVRVFVDWRSDNGHVWRCRSIQSWWDYLWGFEESITQTWWFTGEPQYNVGRQMNTVRPSSDECGFWKLYLTNIFSCHFLAELIVGWYPRDRMRRQQRPNRSCAILYPYLTSWLRPIWGIIMYLWPICLSI